MDADEYFAETWPEVAPRLRAALARAGAPVADREDLVQETAIRLLGMWQSVDWGRPLEPLARTIALNLWRDQWRKTGRRELLGDLVEQAAAADTERAALARVQVGEVSRALRSLPSTTASVLRAAAAETESGSVLAPATSALRMARTRARRALLACVKVASVVVVGVGAASRALARAATPAAALGAIATLACLLTLAAPVGRPGLSAGEAPDVAPAADTPGIKPIPRSLPPAAVPVGAGSLAHRHPSASPTPYYVIDTGAGSVAAWFDVKAFGKGGQVRDPRPGSQTPVCVYGDSPDPAVVPVC
jgi:DNA-directed RNA polymerase specialized sigma24 family protein